MDERIFRQLGRHIEAAHDLYRQILAEHLGDGSARPARPSSAYCLLPPNLVRWDETVDVQQRLWHLLGVLLDHGPRVPFATVEDVVYPGKEPTSKIIQNDVSRLNARLELVRFPHLYRTESGYILVSD